MESLTLLAESMQQGASLLADDDSEESSRQYATFFNAVALGNMGAGKSAVLNSLIGHPVLPTGESGATRAPVIVELENDDNSKRRGLLLYLDGNYVQISASDIRHSLQSRFTKISSRGQADKIAVKLKSSTAPPLKLIDLPGLDMRGGFDDSMVREHVEGSDSILLVVIPAALVRDISGSAALRLAQDVDHEGTRTIGVITKVDQAASDPKSLAAVQALLSGQGPPATAKMNWVAIIGQSVSISAAHSSSAGKDDSLDTAWKAEMETLKSLLNTASTTKLGRKALMDTIAHQIRARIKKRLPSLLAGLEGRNQMVEDVLVRLGERMIETEEGTRAVALELCREFEDKFLLHVNSGEGGSHRVLASFEENLPNRVKQIPLNNLFDPVNVKKVVLEADGYQPYLLSPEKGLRELIRRALELAKDPAKYCVDEVHRILVDIVASAASATPGLSRFPPLKREIVSVATAALDEYRIEARKMVVDLVDMERAFIPPQHFIRLMQRRMEKLRREDELKGRNTRRAQDAEQNLMAKGTAGANGNLKSLKTQMSADAEVKDGSNATDAPTTNGETSKTGFLLKKSDKADNSWNKRWFVLNEKSNKLAYMKKQDDKRFQAVINLEECIVDDASEEENVEGKSSKSKDSSKANGDNATPNLAFKISNKVAYKTVLKAQHSILLKAETMAERVDWMTRLKNCTDGGKVKGAGSAPSEPVGTLRTSVSDSALDTIPMRRPADPEEDLRMMSQEVRDYVEAVLNSLTANVPKAAVLCQVEKSKDSMLGTLYKSLSILPSAKIQELLQEDQEVKHNRQRYQKQASLISKLIRQLSTQDSQTMLSNGYIDEETNGVEHEDWRTAFQAAASPRGSNESRSSSRSSTPRRYASEENGDASRRTPGRRVPPPPPSMSPMYRN